MWFNITISCLVVYFSQMLTTMICFQTCVVPNNWQSYYSSEIRRITLQVCCCKTSPFSLVAWQPWQENTCVFKISVRRAVKETKACTELKLSVRFIITHVYILSDLAFIRRRWRCVQIVNTHNVRIHSSDLWVALEQRFKMTFMWKKGTLRTACSNF